MVRIWLVRHGRTSWNAEGRLQGWADVPLDAVGRAQASSLRRVLPSSFEGVWSSDLRRAVETARLAHGEPRVDVRLRELDFGDLEGCTWEELTPDQRGALRAFDGFRAPGGESLRSLRDRVHAFLDQLPAGEHLVVTHGGVVRMLLGADAFPGHGEAVAVEWAPGRISCPPGVAKGGTTPDQAAT